MFNSIKDYINAGNFDLNAVTLKINTLWIEGYLTDDERDQLLDLARETANPEESYAPLQNQINDLSTQITSIKNDISVLTTKVNDLIKGEETGEIPEPETPTEEYPEYKAPTGAHDAYHKDDKVTFNGNKYICIAPDGVAVVWDPLTYPAYWQEVEA